MWQQANNDAYQLWRQEQALQPARIDRLSDSATITDRSDAPALVRAIVGLLVRKSRRRLEKPH